MGKTRSLAYSSCRPPRHDLMAACLLRNQLGPLAGKACGLFKFGCKLMEEPNHLHP